MEVNCNVRDWAPPGWHWVVLPDGKRDLVRIPGEVRDPDLVWWRWSAPGFPRREPATAEEVRRRIRQEDEQVRRYLYMLGTRYEESWTYLRRDDTSWLPVPVPTIWQRCAPRSAPRGLGPDRS